MISTENIEKLFKDTQLAFDKSDIKKYAIKENKKWYYSISSTQLITNATLIIGFNWGAAAIEYTAQTKIPEVNFKDLYEKKELRSFQRVYILLKQYLPEENIEDSVQTNFCFFRSKKEDEISIKDLELSSELFNKLLQILEPKLIIGFSSTLKKYLEANCIKYQKAEFPSNKRILSVAKGLYKFRKKEIPIFFLPHPNAKFTTESRRKAWDFCFPLLSKDLNSFDRL